MPKSTVLLSRLFYLRSLLLCITILSANAKAQLCSGSLGDAVVNITFGSGGGPSSYVPANSYTYFSSPCPDDGFYTVTNQTSNCFGDSWHTVSSDHSGGGAFMLVNASYTPGDFFITTVTDLCPNTTYEFAAWILNVMKPLRSIRPDITFSIETPAGVQLSTFNTGNIDVTGSPVWKQYGLFFTTPQNNAVIVLRMTNNAPGGIGNDLALDDITFRPCGSKISASILGNNSDTVNVCIGNTNVYQFNASLSSSYQLPLYQWQLSTDRGITWNDIAGATTLTYTRQPTLGDGNYWYRLAVVETSVASIRSCRIASNSVIVNVHPQPITNAGPDRVMVMGNPITLDANADGEQINYSWSPGSYMDDVNKLQPVVSPIADIGYTLYAQSVYGCANQDDMKVKVVAGIFVPNAFTPNADGKNDNWKIPFLDPSFRGEVSVFNRWGQLVYASAGSVVSWDGNFNGVPQAPGVYVYMISFKSGYLKNRRGTLTLIR
ncbi:MAG: gliding motility-associated C-terminal domain-containing protein [Ferruginibacter sp.]